MHRRVTRKPLRANCSVRWITLTCASRCCVGDFRNSRDVDRLRAKTTRGQERPFILWVDSLRCAARASNPVARSGVES